MGQIILTQMINSPAFTTENEMKLANDYVKVRQKLLICEQTTKKDESCAKIDNLLASQPLEQFTQLELNDLITCRCSNKKISELKYGSDCSNNKCVYIFSPEEVKTISGLIRFLKNRSNNKKDLDFGQQYC